MDHRLNFIPSKWSEFNLLGLEVDTKARPLSALRKFLAALVAPVTASLAVAVQANHRDLVDIDVVIQPRMNPADSCMMNRMVEVS